MFSYSEKGLEFLTFDDIVDIFIIYLFIYLFILIIFDVLVLKVGNTSVNIFSVSRATGLSVAYTVMCYPPEIKSLTYLLKLTISRKNI